MTTERDEVSEQPNVTASDVSAAASAAESDPPDPVAAAALQAAKQDSTQSAEAAPPPTTLDEDILIDRMGDKVAEKAFEKLLPRLSQNSPPLPPESPESRRTRNMASAVFDGTVEMIKSDEMRDRDPNDPVVKNAVVTRAYQQTRALEEAEQVRNLPNVVADIGKKLDQLIAGGGAPASAPAPAPVQPQNPGWTDEWRQEARIVIQKAMVANGIPIENIPALLTDSIVDTLIANVGSPTDAGVEMRIIGNTHRFCQNYRAERERTPPAAAESATDYPPSVTGNGMSSSAFVGMTRSTRDYSGMTIEQIMDEMDAHKARGEKEPPELQDAFQRVYNRMQTF